MQYTMQNNYSILRRRNTDRFFFIIIISIVCIRRLSRFWMSASLTGLNEQNHVWQLHHTENNLLVKVPVISSQLTISCVCRDCTWPYSTTNTFETTFTTSTKPRVIWQQCRVEQKKWDDFVWRLVTLKYWSDWHQIWHNPFWSQLSQYFITQQKNESVCEISEQFFFHKTCSKCLHW